MKLSQRHRFQRIVNTLGETSRVPHDLSYFVHLIVDYGEKKTRRFDQQQKLFLFN